MNDEMILRWTQAVVLSSVLALGVAPARASEPVRPPAAVAAIPRVVRPAPPAPRHVAALATPTTQVAHAGPTSIRISHPAEPKRVSHLETAPIPAVRTIIFDWDGTIGDTYGQIKYAAVRAFKDIGVTIPERVPGEDPYRAILDAQALDGMCKRGFPGATPAQIARWSERFNLHSANAPDELIALKPGARAELEALHARFPNTKFAVLSARPQAVLDKMIAVTGLHDMFEMTVGTAGSAIAPKPAPDGVTHILRHLGVDPKSALMVGDHENDIIAGKAAGTKTVALRDGMGHPEALEATKPDFVLDHLELTRHVFVRTREGSLKLEGAPSAPTQ